MDHVAAPQPSSIAPRVGDTFPARTLATLAHGPVRVPDDTRLVHLQLRRYAGCPICSLHLHSFARRHDELLSRGVVEVAVFHSSLQALQKAQAKQPFAVVPDPHKRLYAELGIGTSLGAVLDPRAWLAVARSVATGSASRLTTGVSDGSLGLPGDFLIAPSGRIVALHRGVHADDHWSIDHVLTLAEEHGAANSSVSMLTPNL